ncbi:cytochrome P450 [Chiua virens]|nr:cytochrome P450 [Chiua virens]
MGSSASAVALDLLKRNKNINDPSQLQLIKDTCATAFVAGAETTTTALKCFILAMVQHPEAQARAQAEIDAVVGRTRLPNFDDRANLSYIEAVIMETLRVYTINPLGKPRRRDTCTGSYQSPQGLLTPLQLMTLTKVFISRKVTVLHDDLSIR